MIKDSFMSLYLTDLCVQNNQEFLTINLNNIKLIASAMTLALLGGITLTSSQPAKADWKCKVKHGSFNSRGEFKHTYSEACPHFHENQPPTFHGQYAPAPNSVGSSDGISFYGLRSVHRY